MLSIKDEITRFLFWYTTEEKKVWLRSHFLNLTSQRFSEPTYPKVQRVWLGWQDSIVLKTDQHWTNLVVVHQNQCWKSIATACVSLQDFGVNIISWVPEIRLKCKFNVEKSHYEKRFTTEKSPVSFGIHRVVVGNPRVILAADLFTDIRLFFLYDFYNNAFLHTCTLLLKWIQQFLGNKRTFSGGFSLGNLQ